MNIQLYPQGREDQTFELIKQGDSLIINGETFDFTNLVPGSTLHSSAISSDWFVYTMENSDDGVKTLHVIFPVDISRLSPQQASPALLVDVQDGPVPLPQPLPLPDVSPSSSEDPTGEPT